MNIKIRKYVNNDIEQMIDIWNGVVEEGIAFPQIDMLDIDSANSFFSAQTLTSVAENSDNGEILGLYILHPNNVGRCGHICNASYAVKSTSRGKHIGESLVRDCIEQAKNNGFKILQFNAVVKTNLVARRLYEKLGFVQLGVIPNGFFMKNGSYEDICPYYYIL